jgi:hypothetical protein
VRSAQEPDMKPMSRDLSSSQPSGSRRILHISTPDYSSTMPEVDSTRRNWKSGDEGNEEVSDAWVTFLLVSRLLLSNS